MMQRSPMAPAAILLLVGFASASVLNYGFSIGAARLLSPGDFGLLAFAQTLLLVGGLLLNSGFSWSLIASLVREGEAQRPALVRGAWAANMLVALLLAAAVLLSFATGPLRSGLETWPVAILLALAMPLLASVAIARAGLQGLGRVGSVALTQGLEVAAKCAAGLALVLIGYHASGAVASFMVGATFAAVVGAWRIRRTLNAAWWGPLHVAPLRDHGPMFGAVLGLALLVNLDLIVLKLFWHGNRATTGYYQAGIVLANAPYFLVSAAILPLMFTELVGSTSQRERNAIVARVAKLVILFALPLEAMLFVAPAAILSVFFPADYREAAGALRLLSFGNGLLILCAIVASALQATGRASVAARLLLVVAACEVVMLRVIVPRWGAEGAAATFCGAAAVSLVALALSYARNLDVAERAGGRRWSIRYLVVAGATFAIGWLIWRAAGPVASLSVAGAAYAVLTILFNLISVGSLRRSFHHGDAATALPRTKNPSAQLPSVSCCILPDPIPECAGDRLRLPAER